VEVSRIIAEIDSQISKLQQARALLAEPIASATKTGAKRGRPKGSKNSAAKTVAAKAVPKAEKTVAPKRKLSPEGRKRIAEAMKKRWADRKKQATK
jgi:hypothetical protein